MIRVYVIKLQHRKFLQLHWKDELGKHQVSTKTNLKHVARRLAEEKEAELNRAGGRAVDDVPGSLPWEDFLDFYEDQHLSGLSKNSVITATSSLNMIQRHLRPQTIGEITSRRLAEFVSLRRRADGCSEDTIKKDLRQIRAALQWAVNLEYIAELPKIPVIQRARKGSEMKGSPLTDDEVCRMIAAVPNVMKVPEPWQFMIRGLVLSGLRIEEAFSLRWERGPDPWVDVSDRNRPVLYISASHQKSHEDQRLPLVNDFGYFLSEVPVADRTGFVFQPISNKTGQRFSHVSDVIRGISLIGKAAAILVNVQTGKFASAHDLRRTFGTRWAAKVTPAILMTLMRHKSFATTKKYYIGQDIRSTHDAILQANPDPSENGTRHFTRHPDSPIQENPIK